jgi:serine/threonine-protein kinase
MGAVWRARDEVLGRPVAVKVLHERLAHDPDVLERFRLEAVAAARLSHPNVVRVFDTGIDDGVCFIVMELFEGTTLEDLLRSDGPLSPAEAARLMRSVLQGLAHAHGQGVIHRDVKPGNVLIDRSGLVKVTDFGIAKAAFATSDLTTTGDLLGTARYLAPEQVTGGGVDRRADLYSCGVVLYESLTGRVPFEGDTHLATATMRLTVEPPPPGRLRPGIPRGVEAATMRALARDPEERFHSAEDMSAALDRAAPSPHAPRTSPARSEPGSRRTSVFRSWMAVPLLLVALAAVAVVGFTLVAPLFDNEGEGAGEASGDAGPAAIRVVQALSFDPPPGDGSEHDEALDLATDGDPATFWTTEGYTTPDLGGAKDGVGIVFDVGNPREFGSMVLHTDSPGFAFSVHIGEAPDAFDLDAPLSSGGETSFSAEDGMELAFEPTRTRYLMLWITELVQADNYRAHVNEIEILPPGD